MTATVLDELYPEVGLGVKDTSAGPYPWSGDIRADDKTRIFRYLLNIPEGVAVSTLVEHIFDVDSDVDGENYQRDYKFTERFVSDCPVLKIDRGQQFMRVEARPAAFHLRRPKHCSNTQEGSGVGESSGQFPQDFAEDFLSSFKYMTESRRTMLEKQFVSYREQIEGRYNILRAVDDIAPEYLLVPYSTRFNSDQRADDNWRRYHTSWENATVEYDEGVAVTLSTDPKKFDSLHEMGDKIYENFNRFMSWLRRKLAHRCGDLGEAGHSLRDCDECEEYAPRPDYICSLEFTEKGFPHLHVSFFGIDWIAPQHEISDYWEQYQAEVVDVRQMTKRPANGSMDGIEVDGTEYVWLTATDDEPKNEKAHQGKYLAENMPVNESISDLHDRVDDDDSDLWKTAMFWALGKRFWTASDSLDSPSEEDSEGLLDVARYVFVGAAKSADIPAHVWKSSFKFLDRGPPPD